MITVTVLAELAWDIQTKMIKNQMEATSKIQSLLSMHGIETSVSKVSRLNGNKFHFELIEHDGYQAHHVKFSRHAFDKLAKFFPTETGQGDSINVEYVNGLISSDIIYFALPTIIYQVKALDIKKENLQRLTSEHESTFSMPFNKMKIFWKDESPQ